MISHISGAYLTKQTSEQKRTKDMGIKEKLTVTREEGRRIMEERKGSEVKKHIQGANEQGQWGGDCVWEQHWMGQGRAMEGKWGQLYLHDNKEIYIYKGKGK